ncbi:hypothetical protein OZ487_004823 [Escherichia coli]|nr:hypothetical protein [Escherichia coli]
MDKPDQLIDALNKYIRLHKGNEEKIKALKAEIETLTKQHNEAKDMVGTLTKEARFRARITQRNTTEKTL